MRNLNEREINLSRHFEINDNLQIDLENNMIYFSDTPHAMVVSCPIKEIKLLISILKEKFLENNRNKKLLSDYITFRSITDIFHWILIKNEEHKHRYIKPDSLSIIYLEFIPILSEFLQ